MTQDEAVRYLEYVVGSLQNRDPSIHNYLLTLYAKQKDDSRLLDFLNSQGGEYVHCQTLLSAA